ncbi:hypothetical protein AYI69_g6713, partial [Smittium culicis]
MDDFAVVKQENEPGNPDEDLDINQIFSEKIPDSDDQYIPITEYKDA